MKRNKFSLSNYKLLTCDQGELIPCGIMEVLPGDSIQQATTALIRVSPLVAPVMHPVHVRIHHWFVPNRLIWEDWEKFITGGPDGLDASVYPKIDFSGTPVAAGSLADYLGVPVGFNNYTSALPFRAYNTIYNEFYRDQDLITELTVDVSSGNDANTDVDLQSVCWEKDYFTSANTDTQKGAEVTMPLGSSAPVTGIGLANDATHPTSAASTDYYRTDGTGVESVTGWDDLLSPTGVLKAVVEEDSNNTGFPNIRADLSSATAASVNEVREAFAMQRYAEARQRYGSRYTEYLRYLGIRPSDARLQRPEYLGGGKQTIQFSEVLQTGVDSTDSGVGNLKGHGIAALRSNRYRKFFEEHGHIISMISVKPKTIYTQGLNRLWNRRSKEDFFQRELQHIGMQEILNKEVYAAHSSPAGVFGYQDRYDEYRRMESSVAGEFRPSAGLDHYHMARVFTGDPALNASFVECVPTDRVYASTSTDQLLVMAQHSIQARRMLSKTGAPRGL